VTGALLIGALCTPAGAHERDPLPALWVERPLTVPRGWFTTTAGVARVQPPGGGRRTVSAVEVRYGVLPRLEVRATVGLATRTVGGRRGSGLDDPEIGVRWSVLRREPPATSVAVDLGWRAPYGAIAGGVPLAAGVGVLRPSLLASRQLGPVRLVGAVGGVVRVPEGGGDAPDGWTAAASALVQLGPLAPFTSVAAEGARPWVGAPDERPWVDALAGIGLQLTRGLGVALGSGGPLTRRGSGPVQRAEPRGATTRLSVEASF
jgi:hypothetical protein